jgi:hypothetical protein
VEISKYDLHFLPAELSAVPNRWRAHYLRNALASTNVVLRGAMKKLLCIIAAAMVLVVASSTAMAETRKRSDQATHRMKSPRSVPAPLRQWPPNNPTYEEYLELKRQGWYKEDKS